MRGIATTVFVGWLLAMAIPCPVLAQPDPSPYVMVLPVDGDDLPAAERASIVTELRGALAKYKKFKVMETPKIDLLDEMVEFECLDMDAECVAKIGAKQKAELCVYVKVEKGKVLMLTVESATAKTIQKYESTAGKAEAKADVTGKGLIALFGEVPVEKPKVAKVTITANTDKAEVLVNGTKAGETPLTLELKPGEYTVTIKKETFMIWEDKIKVVADDKPVAVSAVLKPVPKKVVVVPVDKPVDKPVTDGKDPEKKDPEVPTEEPKGDDEVTPFYATWWFWTAVGAATVTIIGVTAAAVGGSDPAYDVGPLRLSISPSAAENDGVFYE